MKPNEFSFSKQSRRSMQMECGGWRLSAPAAGDVFGHVIGDAVKDTQAL
jgi:hypothetical protein